jgi:hypothetical protein
MLCVELPRKAQRVEKVVVGPVGDPQELEIKAKTLQNRRFKPPWAGGRREREGVFQHAGRLAEVRMGPYWYFHYREASSALCTSAVDKEELDTYYTQIAQCVD